ncbi:MAG: helix-turn-helix transcriptional regulator [Clostridia bacterium]|nr:helix-turn-helix transcriptional regulator [Clostridia bacterium]
MTNGERIKYLREKNGFTQKDIATRLGVEPAAISKYELDMREPNIEAIKKLATIFNISIDYLLGRTPDVFVDETDRDTLDISAIKDKYNFTKKKVDKVKEVYKNDTTLSTAINELCCGVGKTTFGETIINTNISMLEIDNIFNDLENSKAPKPQIMMKVKDLENGIIIIEIDSFDDEEMPLDATDRMALYTTKLSQKYNVLGLVMTIDKDENCKIINSIYQKNKNTYYTQLHLPKTVLTAGEYIDIMSRL